MVLELRRPQFLTAALDLVDEVALGATCPDSVESRQQLGHSAVDCVLVVADFDSNPFLIAHLPADEQEAGRHDAEHRQAYERVLRERDDQGSGGERDSGQEVQRAELDQFDRAFDAPIGATVEAANTVLPKVAEVEVK